MCLTKLINVNEIREMCKCQRSDLRQHVTVVLERTERELQVWMNNFEEALAAENFDAARYADCYLNEMICPTLEKCRWVLSCLTNAAVLR
jgi:hypothetical protein